MKGGAFGPKGGGALGSERWGVVLVMNGGAWSRGALSNEWWGGVLSNVLHNICGPKGF